MSVLDQLSQALIGACGVDYEAVDPASIVTPLDWMENSALGVCVAQSASGYYVMLALHAIGLAMTVGSIVMLNLGILGATRSITQAAASSVVRFAWIGLVVNGLSGVALFFSEANKAYYSTAFRIKIALMVISVISTVIVSKTIYRAPLPAEVPLSRGQAFQLYLCLALWASVIVVGRFMSYFSELTV